MKALLSVACVFLAGLLFLGIEERQSRQKEEESRKEVIEAVVKASAKIDEERIKVLLNFSAALDSEETKSIYHQIYHASSAQLKMQNLAVQEHQLLIQILAGKR